MHAAKYGQKPAQSQAVSRDAQRRTSAQRHTHTLTKGDSIHANGRSLSLMHLVAVVCSYGQAEVQVVHVPQAFASKPVNLANDSQGFHHEPLLTRTKGARTASPNF